MNGVGDLRGAKSSGCSKVPPGNCKSRMKYSEIVLKAGLPLAAVALVTLAALLLTQELHAQSETADLSVTQTASPEVGVGEHVTYTITVHNGGPDGATDVTLHDILWAGGHIRNITFAGFQRSRDDVVCVTSFGGPFRPGTVVVGETADLSTSPVGVAHELAWDTLCDIGQIVAHDSVTIQLAVVPESRGKLKSKVRVKAREHDPSKGNNHTKVKTTVR